MTSGISRALELSSRQHDVVLTRQLRAAGVSRQAIGRMARLGWLVAVRAGAWTTARDPSDWQKAVAAWLLVGPHAVLSHRTAARVHRFPHVHFDVEAELSVAYPQSSRLSGVTAHRVTSLEPVDIQSSRGVAVTTPARTIADLAGCLPGPVVARVLDETLISGQVTVESLDGVIARVGAKPGIQALRAMVDDRRVAPAADSMLEARAIAVLRPVGPFEVHFQVTLDGKVLVLDIAWPDLKVAIECDGWAFHGRSRTSFDSDRRRDNLLASHGWITGHVTSAMGDSEILRTAVGLIMRRTAAPT